MTEIQTRASRLWDLWAASLSAACIVHCLGLPLAASILPVAAQVADSHTVHATMVLLAIPVTLWVVWHDTTSGQPGLFPAIALTGLTIMLAALTVPAFYVFEAGLTIAGGTLLGGAHLWRWKQHRELAAEARSTSCSNG